MSRTSSGPAEAGIRSWRQIMRLDRDGTGDGRILTADAWDRDHRPERAVVHLIAAREPRPVAAG